MVLPGEDTSAGADAASWRILRGPAAASIFRVRSFHLHVHL
jgi:hypothetical protein